MVLRNHILNDISFRGEGTFHALNCDCSPNEAHKFDKASARIVEKALAKIVAHLTQD